MNGPLSSVFASIAFYLIFAIFSFALAVLSLLLLPLFIFFIFASLSLLATFFIIGKILYKRPIVKVKPEEGMRGTKDQELLKSLEEMQKRSKGKKIEHR